MKIIVDIAGGLGNQMFTYAFGYALSKEKNAEFIIDTTMQDSGIAREYGLSNYNIVYDDRISWNYRKDFINRALLNKIRRKCAVGLTTSYYVEKNPTVFDNSVYEIDKDTYFKGNFQSEKYFTNYRSELSSIFTPKGKRDPSVLTMAEIMKNEESVSIHIRRGDYAQIGCTVEMDYYDKAINLMLKKVKNPVFYVFSDDISFCEDYFAKNANLKIIYPDYKSENKSIDDMYLMRKCKHNIIANSSFSWWGAWLNEYSSNTVICPELGMWTGDFYPESWTKIKME